MDSTHPQADRCPVDIERWPLSSFVSAQQLDEWCESDDNASVNRAPLDTRRDWLQKKADAKGFSDYKRYLRRLRIRPAGTILEIGAGTFWLSSYLATIRDVDTVVGVELSLERILAFRELTAELFGAPIEKLTYALGDMHRIARPDKSFDLVVCDATLHHADNLVRVLREAWRVLKPGGWFIAFREPSIGRLRPGRPQFDPEFPENGSAMYYYVDGWRSAFVNAWYTQIRATGFFEDLVVRGIPIRKSTLRLLSPLRMALRYPKIVIAGQRPIRA